MFASFVHMQIFSVDSPQSLINEAPGVEVPTDQMEMADVGFKFWKLFFD